MGRLFRREVMIWKHKSSFARNGAGVGSDLTDPYDTEAPFYDIFYDRSEDIPFYLEIARQGDGPVLELACGTGRLLLPLARVGFDVTGLDSNTSTLKVLRTKLRKESVRTKARVHLVLGDTRSFRLKGSFSTAFVAFNSFLHNVTVADEEASLMCAYQHIRPGGVFVVDVFNPDLKRPQQVLGLDKVKHVGKETILRLGSDRFDFKAQILQATFVYDFVQPSGSVRRKVVDFPLRYVLKEELVGLLEKVGFTVEKIYGNLDKSPFEEKSPLIICLARRPS
jgi:SAM-dependent methyltransferase